METPSRPPVDISTIELHKENIQPLPSGRSATQLASLSSHSLSGLGSKLSSEHKRFQLQIDAIGTYDAAGGVWEDGRDGLSADDVAALADDPLDLHLKYARFVLESYPAGNSAVSRLVPILEASTRRFVRDDRYTNDPRYLRLWGLYAKHVESPADCYCFLFTRGIGERVGLLYEEYAAALEAAGKRQEADKIYSIGIARGAVPIERLKKKHAAFKARMLVAPPLPSPPPTALPTPSTSRDARPILAGAGVATAKGVAVKENGARGFAVFQDGAGGETGERGNDWEDLGTNQSRKKENEIEAAVWKGETLHMPTTPKLGALRLEVFRDDDVPPPTPTSNAAAATDVFVRSLRGPSETEMLAKNPFKNYSDADLSVVDGAVTTRPTPPPPAPAAAPVAKKSRKKPEVAKVNADGTKAEAIGCDIRAVYPSEGVEFSFEEIKVMRNAEYREAADGWNGWEWLEAWTAEVARTGRTSYDIDHATGWPLLYDPATQEPLYDFIRPPPVEPSPSPSPRRRSPSPIQYDLSPPPAQQPQRNLLDFSPSPSPAAHLAQPLSPDRQQTSTSPSPSPPSRSFAIPNRPPSPTINTRQAQALVDDLFQHTIKLDDWNEEREEEEEEGEEEPDTEDDDEDVPFWTQVPPSQIEIQSQFTQSSSQASSVMAPFDLSQGAGDSMIASQFSVMSDLAEEEDDDVLGRTRTAPVSMAGMVYADEDENGQARPSPMRLFHDAAPAPILPPTPTGGGFRPVKRAPLGVKASPAPLAGPSRAFQVMPDPDVLEEGEEEADEEEEEEELVSSSQPDDAEEESFDEPLWSEDGPSSAGFGDGFAMGRQAKGRNRFAPLIDNLTPITERTYEYTTGMTATSLSTSQRSRRGSVYPQPLPVEEDDEDDEPSTDDEYAGDQAFVAFDNDDDSDHSSFRTRGGFSSEDEEVDDDVPPRSILEEQRPVLPVPALMASMVTSGGDSSSEWRDSTRKDGAFDDESSAADQRNISVASSAAHDRSFDVSLNTSLPEGYTITGNQSGMTANMLLSETTDLDRRPAFPNPCNPFDAETIDTCLSLASTSVLDLPDVRNLTGTKADKLAGLQKTAKRREAAAKSKSKDRTGVIDAPWDLKLDGEVYTVRQKLGEGSFGAVFQVKTSAPADADASFSSDADDEVTFAVKVEQPTNVWEFHILTQLHSRLPDRTRQSVVGAHGLFAYEDESFLLLDYSDQGTLLDVVNKANESGVAPPTGGVASGLDELVAMFFVVELVRVVELFHDHGFVHGDLKIDNCLVRLEDVPGPPSSWSNAYNREGGAGWSSKGLKVIDFGRTIDLAAFPPGQRFVSELETTLVDCPEMRDREAWSYEPDYFGIASIAFNVLFGRYIETKTVPLEGGGEGEVRHVIAHNLKRYHQAELWTRLFDLCLNPRRALREGGVLPVTSELRAIRGEMEDWLERNANKGGKSLKGLIRKLEMFAMARGR